MEYHIVTVIASLTLVGAGYFLKSYLTEKGKSLATKEDISKITEKVESIKTSFAHETEKMKSELQLSNSKKQLVTQEKLKVLIEFSEKYFLWYTMCTSGHLFKIDCKALSTVSEEKEKFAKAYFEVRMTVSKIKMFVYEKDLILAIGECIGNTLLLQHEFEKAIEAMNQTEHDFEQTPINSRNIPAYYERKSEILKLQRESISNNRPLFFSLTQNLAECYRNFFASI